MITAPLDHHIQLPVAERSVRQAVFGRWFGFEVRALRSMAVYAAGGAEALAAFSRKRGDAVKLLTQQIKR